MPNNQRGTTEARLHARAMALTRWSNTSAADRAAALRRTRDGKRRRVENEIDPQRLLAPAELARRVDARLAAAAAEASAKAVIARKRRAVARLTADLARLEQAGGGSDAA